MARSTTRRQPARHHPRRAWAMYSRVYYLCCRKHALASSTIAPFRRAVGLRSRVFVLLVGTCLKSFLTVLGSSHKCPLSRTRPLGSCPCPGTNPFTSICMGFGCGGYQSLVRINSKIKSSALIAPGVGYSETPLYMKDFAHRL